MIPARAYVLIAGRVQGVGFREATRDQAAQRGLLGMVRNIPDGRVEAVFEGDKTVIADMVEWCHHGPPFARVETVDVLWEGYQGAYPNFRIIA